MEIEQTLGDSEGQGAWHAAVHGVAKSQTGLSNWKSSTTKCNQKGGSWERHGNTTVLEAIVCVRETLVECGQSSEQEYNHTFQDDSYSPGTRTQTEEVLRRGALSFLKYWLIDWLIDWLTWLFRIFVAAYEIFNCGMWTLSHLMWDLDP